MRYEVILADFPWPYSSCGTAKLPYDTMSWPQIRDFDWSEFMAERCVLFSWVTGPLLAQQMLVHEYWRERFDLRYLGTPYVWTKIAKSGKPIGAAGPRPTTVKPQTEWVVAYSNVARGRPFPLCTEAQTQWLDEEDVFAPEEVPDIRLGHSRKPAQVRRKIEELFGDRSRMELFAREVAVGWEGVGNQSATPRIF